MNAYDRCFALAEAGDWHGVLTTATAWAEAEPDNCFARVVCGEALRELGDLDEAVHQLQQATQLEPASLDAWVVLGSVLHLQGRQHDVRKVYETLTALSHETAREFYARYLAPAERPSRPAIPIKVVAK